MHKSGSKIHIHANTTSSPLFLTLAVGLIWSHNEWVSVHFYFYMYGKCITRILKHYKLLLYINILFSMWLLTIIIREGGLVEYWPLKIFGHISQTVKDIKKTFRQLLSANSTSFKIFWTQIICNSTSFKIFWNQIICNRRPWETNASRRESPKMCFWDQNIPPKNRSKFQTDPDKMFT